MFHCAACLLPAENPYLMIDGTLLRTALDRCSLARQNSPGSNQEAAAAAAAAASMPEGPRINTSLASQNQCSAGAVGTVTSASGGAKVFRALACLEQQHTLGPG